MQGKHRPEHPSRRRVLAAAVLGGGAAALSGLAVTRTAGADTADAGTAGTPAARPLAFGHPGMLHTQEAFDRMKSRVDAGTEPWIRGWEKLLANSHSQSGWRPNPQATIIRGGTGQNYGILYNDIHAAYQNALRWKITGDAAHGDTARDICNAWSETLTEVTGNADRFLAAGIYGYQFANAAELIRDYPGFEFGRFQDLMLNVFYPLNDQFLVGHNDACITNYWANWDLCTMASVMAIGILCDDQGLFDRAVDYFHNGEGNGSLAHAVPFLHGTDLAQWQESGRDQGHSIMGIGLMGTVCEMAWSQGVDLYAADDFRFRKACEYVARYNLGHDVPFTPYSWGSGQNCAPQEHTVISSAGRGQARPVWERVYHHYWGRLDQPCPNMAEMAGKQSPEGGGGDYGSASGGYDDLGFGTLTHVVRGSEE